MWKIVCFSALFVVCGCASMPGGFSKMKESDMQKVNASIIRVAKEHVLLQQAVKQSCANKIILFQISSQVVAGTNYLVEFSIPPSCNSENGATKDLICSAKVFQPLPYTNKEPSLSKTTPIPVCQYM